MLLTYNSFNESRIACLGEQFPEISLSSEAEVPVKNRLLNFFKLS